MSDLWTSHPAHLSRTRSPGRGRRRCETAPGISRLGTGCGSACGSTWAGEWKPRENSNNTAVATLHSGNTASNSGNRTQQYRSIGLDSSWTDSLLARQVHWISNKQPFQDVAYLYNVSVLTAKSNHLYSRAASVLIHSEYQMNTIRKLCETRARDMPAWFTACSSSTLARS